MLIKNNISANSIVEKQAKRNKDYEVEFVNTNSTRNDIYELKVLLRRNESDDKPTYGIKLCLLSSILAYPSLEMMWRFAENEYELASRVYHRICDEVDDVKTDYDQSQAPATIIAAKVREAVKPIASSKQEKTNILAVDESNMLQGVSDWRNSIYSNRYPKMSKDEKNKIKEFEGNKTEEPVSRKKYKTREKY